MPATDTGGKEDSSRANFIPDDDSDLVGFALPTRNFDRNVRFADDGSSDPGAFGRVREISRSDSGTSATRNPIAVSIAALGLGLLIGRLLR
jgi:hypothetical protein